MNDTVGIFYETIDGKIIKTTGFSNKGAEISGYYDNGTDYISLEVSNSEFQTWIPRRDLIDFPNSRDPRLPREFDLLFDIKYTSELNHALSSPNNDDYVEIREMAVKYGLV